MTMGMVRVAFLAASAAGLLLTIQVNAKMPSGWMFVRLAVNKAGVPRQMIVVGICEQCAAKNDATLLWEGFAELRKAFPNMPEFKVHAVQEGSENVN
jgi:hypothetical protein